MNFAYTNSIIIFTPHTLIPSETLGKADNLSPSLTAATPPPGIRFCAQVAPADIQRIPARTLRAVNAAAVQTRDAAGQQQEQQLWFSACSLAGSMSDRVFIRVAVTADTGRAVVDVYSDNSSLPSKLSLAVKRAVEGHGR